MDKEKQIDEMAVEFAKINCNPKGCYGCNLCDEYGSLELNCEDYLVYRTMAETFYNAGYRKERVGHWFIREYEFFTCSECGHDYWNSCDCKKEAKERLAEGDTPNYCPNCGAHMKGE